MSVVEYEAADGVAVVTLNRPDRGNAWTGRMETDLRGGLAASEAGDPKRMNEIAGTPEFAEGVAALLERRPPTFLRDQG